MCEQLTSWQNIDKQQLLKKAALGEVVCCLRDTKETGRTSQSAIFAIALKHYFSECISRLSL